MIPPPKKKQQIIGLYFLRYVDNMKTLDDLSLSD